VEEVYELCIRKVFAPPMLYRIRTDEVEETLTGIGTTLRLGRNL